MDAPLLHIDKLVTSYATERGRVRAVDEVSLRVGAGERVGVVGESGCGKSTVALSVLRLLTDPPGRIESGRVLLGGKDLLALSEREMRAVRGRRISMVFQEPMSSLNPVRTVGSHVMEAFTAHHAVSTRTARARALEMLERVGMPSAGLRFDAWPHQLSGGMRQRVMIAMGLISGPEVMLADEPTTALDVTTQAQILELLEQMQRETRIAIVLITHDLGVLANFVRRVVVMYAGQVVEEAPVLELFAQPLHPYTRALLDSLPSGRGLSGGRLKTIAGRVPELDKLPRGCRFRDRCGRAQPACEAEPPSLQDAGAGRAVRCFNPLGDVR